VNRPQGTRLRVIRAGVYPLAFSVSVLFVPVIAIAFFRYKLSCERGDSNYSQKAFSLFPYGWECGDGTSERTWGISFYFVCLLCFFVTLFFVRRMSISGARLAVVFGCGVMFGVFAMLVR
jgi:hypothetical protein